VSIIWSHFWLLSSSSDCAIRYEACITVSIALLKSCAKMRSRVIVSFDILLESCSIGDGALPCLQPCRFSKSCDARWIASLPARRPATESYLGNLSTNGGRNLPLPGCPVCMRASGSTLRGDCRHSPTATDSAWLHFCRVRNTDMMPPSPRSLRAYQW
jgi:hypothetical protein